MSCLEKKDEFQGEKKQQQGSAELLKLAADFGFWQPGSNVACQRRGGTERQLGESEGQHKQSGQIWNSSLC